MDETRRTLIVAAAGAATLPVTLPASAAEDAGAPLLEPVPALPKQPTPGQAGDFDFLAGEWRIKHWRLPPGAKEWDRFDGEATCWTILGGVGSVEELRIPSRKFSGMGLRLLDVDKRQWIDHWVNGRSGVMTLPGLPGSFENGSGLFWAEDEEAGRKSLSIGIWDRITARSCRWRQATSEDGGRTWAHNWVMDWQKA